MFVSFSIAFLLQASAVHQARANIAPTPTKQQPARVPDTADGIFQEAVGHWGSSSSDAALVTIVDARSNVEHTVCMEVDSLGRAIALENRIPWPPGDFNRVTDRMRSQRDRRFVFNRDEALQQLGKGAGYPESDKELCSLIRKNIYAYTDDWAPTLHVGELHTR